MRQICKHCRDGVCAPTRSTSKLPSDFRLERRRQKVYPRGKGCRECRHTGYRGRTGLYELLSADDELRQQIVQHKSATEMLVAARKKGMRLMRDDGWAKCKKGMTTVEEILRVTKTEGLPATAG